MMRVLPFGSIGKNTLRRRSCESGVGKPEGPRILEQGGGQGPGAPRSLAQGPPPPLPERQAARTPTPAKLRFLKKKKNLKALCHGKNISDVFICVKIKVSACSYENMGSSSTD
jgi:hypothetical protein